MKTVTKGQVFLLAICLAVLGWSLVEINHVPGYLQYVFPAPDQPSAASDGEKAARSPLLETEERLKDASEEWKGILSLYSLDGIVEKASLSVGNSSLQARLTLLGPDGEATRSLIPRSGRLIHPEEIAHGDRVILLDENLALQLFRISDPLEKEVTVAGEKYRIVGILRHTRQVGDNMDFGAYIPLHAVAHDKMTLDALCITGIPVPGTGAHVMMQGTVSVLFPGGTMINLSKEKTGAWLWLRMLLFLIVMVVLLRYIRVLAGTVVLFAKDIRIRLRERYAIQLLGWMAGKGLLLAGGFALAALAFVAVMNMILQPVYIYPEWIPPVLVEVSDIRDTFWNVWKGYSAMVEMRTPELLRLRFFTLLTDGFSALAGVVLFSIYRGFRTRGESIEASLKAFARSNCAEVFVTTGKTTELEGMGFAALAENAGPHAGPGGTGKVPMVRIVSVEQALKGLSPSKKAGSFVLDVTDPLLNGNNLRLEIRCDGKENLFRETGRDWDIQMDIVALAKLLYGNRSLQAFLETESGCELHMHMEVMDSFFAQHLKRYGAGA